MIDTEIRKKYSWLGLSYAVFMIVLELAGILLFYMANKAGLSISDNSWLTLLFGLGPIWLIGFPICCLMLRRLPSEKPEEHAIRPKYMIQFYLMTISLMMIANILGIIITSLIERATGLTINNTTIDLLKGQDILPTIIFAGILGPIMEELAFRKLLIDKIGQYSRRYAIFLSGIMFGLFHTNLHQFFYATVIGCIFAYIYTISGRVRYSAILHILFNMINGLIPMAILKNVDMSALENVSTSQINNADSMESILEMYSQPMFIVYMLYVMLIFILVIVGFILYLLNVKKMKVNDEGASVKKGMVFKTIYLNIGMILFIAVTIGITIFDIYGMSK